MVKENTHLFFAMQIKSKLPKDIKNIIDNNLSYYLIGSITPDIFYYMDELSHISDKLHGESQEKSNYLILKFINNKKLEDQDFAFLAGYLTHYVADIIFHPIVYSLTGNYYDTNLKKAEKAIYRHRLFETQIDKKINTKYYVSDLINDNDFKKCDFYSFIKNEFKISNKVIFKLYNSFISKNRHFKNSLMYSIVLLLYKFKLFKKTNLALFYSRLDVDNFILNFDKFVYLDLFSGKQKTSSLDELTIKTISMAQIQIENLFNYFKEEISLENFAQIYNGKSLDTGTFKRTSEIKYFKE